VALELTAFIAAYLPLDASTMQLRLSKCGEMLFGKCCYTKRERRQGIHRAMQRWFEDLPRKALSAKSMHPWRSLTSRMHCMHMSAVAATLLQAEPCPVIASPHSAWSHSPRDGFFRIGQHPQSKRKRHQFRCEASASDGISTLIPSV
jgi:hypothetical protein